MGRILGIDYGTVRIGLSISDETQTLARILTTLLASKKTEDTVDALLKEISSYKIDEIVLGMPLHMNGKVGFLGDEVNHFADLLRAKIAVPVTLWDERLTTVQAERSLREANMNRKKRSKIIDSVTAVILLQSYLDNKKIKQIRDNHG